MKTGNICQSQNLVQDYKFMKNILERACNKIIRYTKWYDQYWSGVQKFWYLNQFGLQVVNLGSNSGKYAFLYEGLNVRGMNWAVGPQSLEHDYNILKNYFSYLHENAIVIITLCPFSSLKSFYSKDSNLKYYTFLHPATIIDFDEQERIKALRIKASPIREIPLICIKRTVKEILCCVFRHKAVCVDFELHAQQFLKMWKEQFGIKDLDAPLSDVQRCDQKERIEILSEMIDFCIERELRPILVMPPIYHTLAQKLSPKCRTNYIYSFVKEANSHNIPFLNYMDDLRFQKEKYFQNSFFMSRAGAKVFTGTVLKELKDYFV